MKYTFKKFLELDKETQRQISTLTEEMSVSMKKKKMIELETLLKSHDWFYFYSDDSRSYRKGDEEHSKIRRLVDFIGKDGKKLYKSYGKQRGVM
jgi:hypothetical protein